jgi:hypothetical protein
MDKRASKIKDAWNNTSGTQGNKSYSVQNLQIKDITYVDITVEGCNLAARDRNGYSDPYYVIKVPTEQTKKSEKYEIALEVAKVGELIYHVVEYSITPWLLPFDLAKYSYDFASKTHPQTKGFKEIWKSSVIKKTLNPKFDTHRVGFYELCWGDVDLPFLFEVWDWDRYKPSDLIGFCFITVRDLLKAETTEIEIRDKKDKKTGTLKFNCVPSNYSNDLSKEPRKSDNSMEESSKNNPTETNLRNVQSEPDWKKIDETSSNSNPSVSMPFHPPLHTHSVPTHHHANHGNPGLVHAHSVGWPASHQHNHNMGSPSVTPLQPPGETYPHSIQHAQSYHQPYPQHSITNSLSPPIPHAQDYPPQHVNNLPPHVPSYPQQPVNNPLPQHVQSYSQQPVQSYSQQPVQSYPQQPAQSYPQSSQAYPQQFLNNPVTPPYPQYNEYYSGYNNPQNGFGLSPPVPPTIPSQNGHGQAYITPQYDWNRPFAQ